MRARFGILGRGGYKHGAPDGAEESPGERGLAAKKRKRRNERRKGVLPFQGKPLCVLAGFPGRLPWADEWQPFGLKNPPASPTGPKRAGPRPRSSRSPGFTPLPFYPADDLHDLIYRLRGVALSGRIIVCVAEFPGRLPWANEWQPFGLGKSGGCTRTRRAQRNAEWRI
jgi:hypothetical protein